MDELTRFYGATPSEIDQLFADVAVKFDRDLRSRDDAVFLKAQNAALQAIMCRIDVMAEEADRLARSVNWH